MYGLKYKHIRKEDQQLNSEIDKIIFSPYKIPIISNYSGEINYDINEAVNSLKKQMANRVKWTDSIKKLEETNVSEIIEIGPGKVLSGLISRISNKFVIRSVDKIEDLEKFK